MFDTVVAGSGKASKGRGGREPKRILGIFFSFYLIKLCFQLHFNDAWCLLYASIYCSLFKFNRLDNGLLWHCKLGAERNLLPHPEKAVCPLHGLLLLSRNSRLALYCSFCLITSCFLNGELRMNKSCMEKTKERFLESCFLPVCLKPLWGTGHHFKKLVFSYFCHTH